MQAWDLTPRELVAYSRGVAERDAARQRLAVAGAWHAAVLSRMKRIPKLKALLRKITGPRRPTAVLSPRQQLNQLNHLALALGGKPLAKVPKLKKQFEES